MKQDLSIYLICTYIGKPKDSSKTHLPGYMSDQNNIEYEERLIISRGLKDKARQAGHVVLNITEQIIVKNTFTNDTDFMSMLAHYVEHYGDYINSMVNALNNALDNKTTN